MKKKILVTLLLISYLLWLNSVFFEQTFATSNSSNVSLDEFSTLTDVNKWTFNEYRYRIINEYFSLKSSYESSGIMNKQNLENMSKFAKTWYNYLPDSLINKNLLNDLLTSLKKAYTENNSEVNYEDVVNFWIIFSISFFYCSSRKIIWRVLRYKITRSRFI